MTANKRIALNIVATYGRSLYSLACGLFTSRWVLMALGQIDFGLYSVIGGMIFFVSFINGLLATAVGRFYAFHIGAAKNSSTEEGLEECRKWFNVALVLHIIFPTALIALGYPIGVWTIENYLTIPPGRVEMCVWVWRFACTACFFTMANVPFQAMYTAKQEIAELTIYGVLGTSATVVFLGYMVTHPGAWLVKYSLGMMFISAIPQLVICIMAVRSFPECQINWRYFYEYNRYKEILYFSGCQLFRALAKVVATQGTSIVVNKFLGPERNASVSVGQSVAVQANGFSGSIVSAFYPAITNAAGEGNFERVKNLTYRVCLFASIVILIFAVPLWLELDYVLALWLKNPPIRTWILCRFVLGAFVISQFTEGCWVSVFAVGKIGAFQFACALIDVLLFAIVFCLVCFGVDVEAVGVAMVFSAFLTTCVHLYFAHVISGISYRYWFFHVLIPVVLPALLAISGAGVVVYIFHPSFLRLSLTVLFSECIYIPLIWRYAFSQEDRDMVLLRFSKIPGALRRIWEKKNVRK